MRHRAGPGSKSAPGTMFRVKRVVKWDRDGLPRPGSPAARARRPGLVKAMVGSEHRGMAGRPGCSRSGPVGKTVEQGHQSRRHRRGKAGVGLSQKCSRVKIERIGAEWFRPPSRIQVQSGDDGLSARSTA